MHRWTMRPRGGHDPAFRPQAHGGSPGSTALADRPTKGRTRPKMTQTAPRALWKPWEKWLLSCQSTVVRKPEPEAGDPPAPPPMASDPQAQPRPRTKGQRPVEFASFPQRTPCIIVYLKITMSISKDGLHCNIALRVQFCTIPKLPIHPAIWQVEFNSRNLFPALFLCPLC